MPFCEQNTTVFAEVISFYKRFRFPKGELHSLFKEIILRRQPFDNGFCQKRKTIAGKGENPLQTCFPGSLFILIQKIGMEN